MVVGLVAVYSEDYWQPLLEALPEALELVSIVLEVRLELQLVVAPEVGILGDLFVRPPDLLLAGLFYGGFIALLLLLVALAVAAVAPAHLVKLLWTARSCF